jgi:acyl-coenzyme A synthetase/AMP-(fatty) acid ligase/thioesterase domain-containing protein/acyl carrier protein
MRPGASSTHAGVAPAPAWLDDDPRPLDWNGPVDRLFTRFPDAAEAQPIIDRLEHAARLNRDRIAIRNSETALTYGELWDGLCGLAETLEADSATGDLIAILLPASPMFALAMFACLAAGRPFVVLDADHPQEWLDHALADARPTLMITREGGHGGVATSGLRIRVIELTALPKPARKCWRPVRLSLDEPACVLFTSGSTGRPKGIVNSQRNLLQRVTQSINAAHINAEDRFLTLASPCTIVGVRDVMTALLAGASIHLLDPQRAAARDVSSVIRAEAITILFAFPAFLRSVIAASAAKAGATLRLIRVGGDTTLWSDIDMLRSWLPPRAAIQVIYAATEAPMLQWFVEDSCRGEDARVPIGYPLPGNRLAIVDEHGCVTQPGDVGELMVASPYVSLGRWTDGRCAHEPLETDSARACRVFRTGDLVRQRPDGLLERVGRKDRQVKILGARVHLEGVEAFLRKHRFVRDVAALARTSSANGATTLVAYVSPHDEAPAGLIAELRALMRTAPAPMRPTRFYLADRIPRLPSSKLDVRTLSALDDSNVHRERAEPADEATSAPMTNDRVAQAVARVWQEVLLAPVRGPRDDFFDAGGDSLAAITFAMELERELKVELSPTLIYETPSFSGFCEALRERRAPRYDSLVLLKAGAGSPPLFIVHGVGGNVIDILPTARRMAYPGAVIGIRARGLARGEMPHSSVEAMAADYLREIKARQPNGPYCLCGYSFGGLVAFEIARRLSESGDEVGFVGLFDTLMSPLRWPLRAWVAIIGRRIARLPADLSAAPLRTWVAGLRKFGGRLWAGPSSPSASRQRNDAAAPGVPRALPSRVARVAASALIASARYRPGLYCGQLTLFTPGRREPGLPSLEAIWRKHARAITVVETGGEHSTMLSASHAEDTAASVSRWLRASIRS